MTNEQSVLRKGRRTPAEIQQIVSEFESSGLNRSQFCRHQGLTFGVLNRYLRRLAAAYGGGATSDGLVAVELAGKKLGAERTDGCDFQAAIRQKMLLFAD
jgi:hypothetical protein